ncbi:hypothetical protein ACBY01_04435 [Sphingomonas sp. ac-8]|uniref:hypothetical protein n=1 Tax=Sphingomonas sp. ac-8 TaxID=3242977 RepID=UPI003A7F906B
MRSFLLSALALSLATAGVPAHASGGAGAPHLVTMDELAVPIVDGARADGTLRFQLVLEAKDEGAAHALTAALPLLRAAALSEGLEFARLYASPRLPVDARRLASRLTAALQAQKPGIARVLIVKVMAVPA